MTLTGLAAVPGFSFLVSFLACSTMLRRLQPHVPGLVYTGLLMLVGLAAMNNQNNLLFWVFGVMVAGVVISGLISHWMMFSLSARRLDPSHGAVGEPLVVRYALTNRSRLLAAFNVLMEEKPVSGPLDWRRLMKPAKAWVMHAAPRETVHGETIFWPTRRGELAFDQMRIWTTFPFGIVRKSIRVSQPQHTLIYPMLYELRHDLLDAVSPGGLMGARITQQAGAGDDFFGVREHRPGDSMRHIAWKRTAQLDQIVTIERTTPSPAKVRIILDLTVPTEKLHVEPAGREAARELEEQAISFAASVIHLADLTGYEIGLSLQGVDQAPIPVRRNQWHLRKLMAALAEIDLDRPRLPARSQPVREAERAGLIVIAPDRVRPLSGREDALYLTARQLSTLAVRPIGWDPSVRVRAGAQSQSAAAGKAASPISTPRGRGGAAA